MKSDLEIKQDVIAEMKWEPSINAAAIGVEVADGVVTLAGSVDSFAEKWDVEEVVRRVSGVKALAIDIKVNLPGDSLRSDGDIARSAVNVLEWTTYVPDNSVKVLVEDGFITLKGKVDWEYQRRAAVNSIRNLMGVKGVSDQLVITSKVSVNSIRKDIQSALERGASSDSARIEVSVNGGDVTLSGNVRSWSERYLARHAAWGTHGVCSVIDNMVVG